MNRARFEKVVTSVPWSAMTNVLLVVAIGFLIPVVRDAQQAAEGARAQSEFNEALALRLDEADMQRLQVAATAAADQRQVASDAVQQLIVRQDQAQAANDARTAAVLQAVLDAINAELNGPGNQESSARSPTPRASPSGPRPTPRPTGTPRPSATPTPQPSPSPSCLIVNPFSRRCLIPGHRNAR